MDGTSTPILIGQIPLSKHWDSVIEFILDCSFTQTPDRGLRKCGPIDVNQPHQKPTKRYHVDILKSADRFHDPEEGGLHTVGRVLSVLPWSHKSDNQTRAKTRLFCVGMQQSGLWKPRKFCQEFFYLRPVSISHDFWREVNREAPEIKNRWAAVQSNRSNLHNLGSWL
jgi:hypothetical protein